VLAYLAAGRTSTVATSSLHCFSELERVGTRGVHGAAGAAAAPAAAS
jgi:hypothetical protein